MTEERKIPDMKGDKNPQSEVQYLEGVIKDLDFIRSSYILREKGEYWDGEEG